MKRISLLVLATIGFVACDPFAQPQNDNGQLSDRRLDSLSYLEAKLVGRWNFYQLREILNAPPVYSTENRSDLARTRKDDWIQFDSDRQYTEFYYGEPDTVAMWFEADNVTMRYQLLNRNDEVLRIEHYDFRGPDTLVTSMDNVQFVWVKKKSGRPPQ